MRNYNLLTNAIYAPNPDARAGASKAQPILSTCPRNLGKRAQKKIELDLIFV